MRKTKKMIEAEEQLLQLIERNSIICRNLIMQKLGLELNSDGYVTFCNEDEDSDECEVLSFDGKKCTLNLRDETTEILFDPYNNIKLACSLMHFYMTNMCGFNPHGDILLLFLTNDTIINKPGCCQIKFEDGYELIGNIYCRDTLKYIDIIYILDGSSPIEFNALRGIDIIDNING